MHIPRTLFAALKRAGISIMDLFGTVTAVKGHRDYDAVTEVVRGWYVSSTPEVGISAIHEGFGFLINSDRASFRRLVLTVNDPAQLDKALGAAAEFYGASDFEVWVDDRDRAKRLEGGLSDAGLHKLQDTVVLALVGAIRAEAGPHDLIIEDVVDSEGLLDWARVKLQGFADDEELPPPHRLKEEVDGWQREWPICRYQLGRLEDEAVGILGYYTGTDQMVHNLATRLPYRHRRIAQAMLANWATQAESTEVRSLLINCDDGGRAAALYERLGFTDEVYWHRRYGRLADRKS